MRLETDEAFRRYADRVYASAFSITRDPTDADDATQDTFLRYHTRSDDFESEAHLKAWLLRVAINRAKDLSGSLSSCGMRFPPFESHNFREYIIPK